MSKTYRNSHTITHKAHTLNVACAALRAADWTAAIVNGRINVMPSRLMLNAQGVAAALGRAGINGLSITNGRDSRDRNIVIVTK